MELIILHNFDGLSIFGRLSKVKGVSKCEGGGFFKELQSLLLAGGEVKCESCKALLTRFRFSSLDMQTAISDCLSGKRTVRVPGSIAQPGDEDENETLDALLTPPCKKKKIAKGNEDREIHEYVNDLEHITLLTPGSHGKACPFECSLCRAKTWPTGRVLEASEMRLSSIKHFIGSHLRSEMHLRNLRRLDGIPEEEEKLVECKGLNIEDPVNGNNLFIFRDEVALWGSMVNLAQNAQHVYVHNATEGTWKITSQQCQRRLPLDNKGSSVCSKCKALGERNGVIRCVVRFMLKYWAAQCLSCKLYQGEEALNELHARIRKTMLYQGFKARVDSILSLPPYKMQQYVRSMWLSDATCASGPLAAFVDIVVRPAIQINIDSVPSQLAEISARFAAILAGGMASEEDMVSVKMAATAISGRLTHHPFVQGLCLQLFRKLDKEDSKGGFEMLKGSKGF